MTEQPRHESADLGDYEVDDAYDTLDGDPGDDPLERGVTPPQRWSRAIRSDPDTEESLDDHLAEEEPDATLESLESIESDEPEDADEDEDVGDEEVDGLLLDDGPDPRAGRLVADDEGAHPVRESELIAHDEGVSGGAASAEEASVHVVEDDDTDIRSDG